MFHKWLSVIDLHTLSNTRENRAWALTEKKGKLKLTISPPIPLRLYTLPYWSNPLFLIFDIRALWRSGLGARAPECQKLKTVGQTSMALNPLDNSNLEHLLLKGLSYWYSVMYVLCRFDMSKSKKEMWPDSYFTVVVGAHRIRARERSRRRHRVRQIVMHEKYLEQQPRYDVMLIRLKTAIKYNRVTRPICVDDTVFPDFTKCIVTGWGSVTAERMSVMSRLHVKRNYFTKLFQPSSTSVRKFR